MTEPSTFSRVSESCDHPDRKCLGQTGSAFRQTGSASRQTGSASDKQEVHLSITKCTRQMGSAANKQEALPANRKCHPQVVQIFGNVGNLNLDGNAREIQVC